MGIESEVKIMMLRTIVAAAAFALVAVGGAMPVVAQATDDSARIEEIRNRLLRLPYYGPFDFLAFSYEKGTVTLTGYAAHSTLSRDAERAVRQVSGVDQVVNKIEELPVSQNDDDIRWRTYFAIYSDPFLARYAPGGGMLWGHRHRPGRFTFGSARRFPGVYPVGNYPISIIVNRGRITLMGVVDSESDRNMAEIRARGVAGSFGVENELTVESRKTS